MPLPRNKLITINNVDPNPADDVWFWPSDMTRAVPVAVFLCVPTQVKVFTSLCALSTKERLKNIFHCPVSSLDDCVTCCGRS